MEAREVLDKLEVGGAISLISKKSDKEEVSIIVKEDEYHLNKIGKAPMVNIRGGIVRNENAAVMIVMFNFNDVDYKYELWLNYRNNFGKKAVTLLLNQETILIECCDKELKTVHQFRINNSLKKLATSCIAISGEYITWDNEDCIKLVEELYVANPNDIDSVWNRLSVE
jgi:hypothetical protein